MKSSDVSKTAGPGSAKKVILELAVLDMFFVFAVLMCSRGLLPGVFPRWYYLAMTSVLWAVSGILTHKLEFWYYSRRLKAVTVIAVVDILLYLTAFAAWKLMFPERGITYQQLWPLPFIMAVECLIYLFWYTLYNKVPFLYVENIERPYCERGMENAAQYLKGTDLNSDLAMIFNATSNMSFSGCCNWIKSNMGLLSKDTLVVNQGTVPVRSQLETPPQLLICLEKFNDISHLNDFLASANSILANGGILSIAGESSGMRRHRLQSTYPPVIAQTVVFFDYLWSRVMSKLTLSRRLFMSVTGGRNRNVPRVEMLGRIARAGFEISGDEIRNNSLYITARKCHAPIERKPHYGLFVRLPRRGKDGKEIGVFKLRTMYAYAEYIQDYTYKINGLEKGGKMKDDFRVNLLGHFFRSRFIDEIPMFINLFMGDLKLVGVRPLSRQYFSLYTPEMQRLHLSVKPGIFPPLYYDYPKPETIDQIQESERRYIESYRCRPLHTDWTYFWGMAYNILFRRERSH